MRGEQGSGPEGVDDLCFHTYGDFSPPPSSPPPPPPPPMLYIQVSRTKPTEKWTWDIGIDFHFLIKNKEKFVFTHIPTLRNEIFLNVIIMYNFSPFYTVFLTTQTKYLWKKKGVQRGYLAFKSVTECQLCESAIVNSLLRASTLMLDISKTIEFWEKWY